jgi:capsular polysaccharide biosynthesis protein
MIKDSVQEIKDDEIEIDLMELLYAIRQHIFAVIVTTFLGGIIALLISIFLIRPQYSSRSTMLVLTKETTLASLADIQMGSQLTNDYQVFITSRPVLEEVLFNLNQDMPYQNFKSMISIENPNNTRIINLTVKCDDPLLAMQLVNELARVSSAFIGDKMEVVPPKIIEEGILPTQRTSPSHKKNLIIGMFAGLVISCGIVALFTIMDDSIKSEGDIVKYLDLPMLASVPDRKDYINKQAESKKKKKKKGLSGALKKGSSDKK